MWALGFSGLKGFVELIYIYIYIFLLIIYVYIYIYIGLTGLGDKLSPKPHKPEMPRSAAPQHNRP